VLTDLWERLRAWFDPSYVKTCYLFKRMRENDNGIWRWLGDEAQMSTGWMNQQSRGRR
jgi:hypothetical protein